MLLFMFAAGVAAIWWLLSKGKSSAMHPNKDNAASNLPDRLSGSAWRQKPPVPPTSPKRDRSSGTNASRTTRKTRSRAWRLAPRSLWDSNMWPPPAYAIDDRGALSFTYADANGEVTHRRITNWSEDGEYDHCFRGWCTDRREQRTFRIDRVQSWG